MMTFSELNLNNPLLNALKDLGFTHPTTIQKKVFSVMMSGQDVLGIAQTGTGKTLAYLLPCLRQWTFSKDRFPRMLIIVPTRELVVQVVEEVEKLSAYMTLEVTGVYGGTNIKSQMAVINGGVDVIVATPGRLLDLVLNGTLRLKNIKKLVIDEVDEMLNLGFRSQLVRILDLLPVKRQNLLFSATINEEVEQFLESYFINPVKIEATPVGTPLDNIQQAGYNVPNFYTKVNLLSSLIADETTFHKVLVFTASKSMADQLHKQMEKLFPGQAGVVHSNKDQNYRFNAVKQFQLGNYRLLIATDLIARGLDIAEVSHVINFDTPEIPEHYIHRIGRTGRADKKGISITFITEKEKVLQAKIEQLMQYEIPMFPLPADLEISTELTEDEKPKVHMKTIQVKVPKVEVSGPAFHEKKEKNKKVNRKISRADQMKLKYKKPKTRGQKRK